MNYGTTSSSQKMAFVFIIRYWNCFLLRP